MIRSRSSRAKTIAAVALLAGSAAAAAPAAPQSPIVSGPFDSVLEAVQAAHRCGVLQLRFDARPIPNLGEARLYLDGDNPPEAIKCLVGWTTISGRRLKLLPRWYGDTFEGDAPAESRPPS